MTDQETRDHYAEELVNLGGRLKYTAEFWADRMVGVDALSVTTALSRAQADLHRLAAYLSGLFESVAQDREEAISKAEARLAESVQDAQTRAKPRR